MPLHPMDMVDIYDQTLFLSQSMSPQPTKTILETAIEETSERTNFDLLATTH